jgi:two-component system sensor histidine kinase SenX3
VIAAVTLAPAAALAVLVVVAISAFVVGRGSRHDVASTRPVPEQLRLPEPSVSPVDEEQGDQDDLFARLSQAVDQIDQGVIVCNADGTDLFRNRVAQTYTEARDGRVLVEAAVQEQLLEALAGRSVRREVDLFGPPAQSFVVGAYPFAEGDGALVLVEDRSLQRRTETVRRDFVANISHELKTPIGALGLLAETIRDEPDPEVVARLSSRMIAEADRASRTVDDLLELSRIEFGDDAEMAEVAAAEVIGEAAGRIASAAEHAGISVRVEADADLRLLGDRRQLVSAVFNLLDNAVKYSPEGAEVLVRARPEPGGRLSLVVADDGVGIPRRDLDRVFERFYRVDRARSRGTGGTGLGLAIVRHVASNHGGEVTVESTEGIGSTFTLTLPASGDPSRDRPHDVALTPKV